MAETTVGVLIEYLLLIVLSRLFERGSENPHAFRTGEYGDTKGTFTPGVFLTQIIIWLTCVSGMKLVLPLTTPPFAALCGILLRVFSLIPALELALVTLLAPCGLRALQVWITDDFLKKEGESGAFWLLVKRALPRSAVVKLEDALIEAAPEIPTAQEARPAKAELTATKDTGRVSRACSCLSGLARRLAGFLSSGGGGQGVAARANQGGDGSGYRPPPPPPPPAPSCGGSEKDNGGGVGLFPENSAAALATAERQASGGSSHMPTSAEAVARAAAAPDGGVRSDLRSEVSAAGGAAASSSSRPEQLATLRNDAASDQACESPEALKELVKQREEELRSLQKKLEQAGQL